MLLNSITLKLIPCTRPPPCVTVRPYDILEETTENIQRFQKRWLGACKIRSPNCQNTYPLNERTRDVYR